MELTHTATREGRLSSFLREEMGLSVGLMNRLKWKEKLFVNGKAVHTDYAVCIGDIITAQMDAPKPEYPAQQGELTILYEDDFLLAVDKPAGMLIHPSRSCNEGTLANLVLGHYEQTGQHCAFHPVTRLDRDTFGIVLIAKNSFAHAALQKTQIQKTYHALVLGAPEEDGGVWNAPIARKPLPSLIREIRADGKSSVTEFFLLQQGEECSVLALHPITGRTHQLRLHCAHFGVPILGDPQYGQEKTAAISEKMGFSSQQLCAKKLEFLHPVTGEAITLESECSVG